MIIRLIMKIKWFAHASFLIEGNGLRIITDPYTPDEMGFPPITEPADIVIRSSSDDGGHCYAEMIPGDPDVVTATEIIPNGVKIRGLKITAIPVRESLIHKDSPLDNGMYRFTLEGIRLAHMGDVGNALTDEQLEAMSHVDVLFVLAGGPPSRHSAMQDEEIIAAQPWVPVLYESAKAGWGEGRPRHPMTFEMIDAVGLQVNRAIIGEQSPQEAMDELNETITTMLTRAGYLK